MTKRERAEMHLYDLYNVAEHVDKCSQCARSSIEYDPAKALADLRAARSSAFRVEMHYDDAIRALDELVAESKEQPKDNVQ